MTIKKRQFCFVGQSRKIASIEDATQGTGANEDIDPTGCCRPAADRLRLRTERPDADFSDEKNACRVRRLRGAEVAGQRTEPDGLANPAQLLERLADRPLEGITFYGALDSHEETELPFRSGVTRFLCKPYV